MLITNSLNTFSRIILALLLFYITSCKINAQSTTDAEIKTALIYNFLKYIEHPDYAKSDTLIIGIYGDDNALIQSLKKLELEKVNGKNLKIRRLQKEFLPLEINVLFLFTEHNFELSNIFREIQNTSILFITDRAVDKREVMINFIHPENNTIQFEINSKNLSEANFSVSPKLLVLGGTELDVRELYKESEKSLLTEQKRSKHIQQELEEKENEVYKLNSQLNNLQERIDSLNSIIIFQINNIRVQQSNVDTLKRQLTFLVNEADYRKSELDSINHSLGLKNKQISELDISLNAKQQELKKKQESLTQLLSLIDEKQRTVDKQSVKIESQTKTLLISFAFLLLLSILIIVVYGSYNSKKKRSKELEKRNKQINLQKEQIEFQADELKMKNLELEKLSIVAEQTDNSVIILNKDGSIEWVNNGFERMQECTLSEFVEQYGKNFIEASNNIDANDILATCLLDKKPVTYESNIHTDTNNSRWVQSTLTPILNSSGEVIKFVAIDTDISKLKEAEKKILKKTQEVEEKAKTLTNQANDLTKTNQELEKQKNRAEKTLKKLKNAQSQLVTAEKMASLGQLTSGIAHEINNPINYISSSIEGLVDIIKDIKYLIKTYDSKTNLKEDKAITQIKKDIEYDDLLIGFDELTGNIKLGVDRTKEIVNSLRTFSRIDEDNYSEIDVNQNINSAIILLGKHHKDRINITTNFGELPLVPCVAGKISQVFLNILVNSVQAIENIGEIKISTSVVSIKKIDYAKIDFKDSGVGMPKHIIERIFEPFYTTKDVGEGTGLGLSITYSIIDKHKGIIDVDSKVGKGTTISIYLPIKNA